MLQTHLTRYLTYSSFIHILFLGYLLVANFSKKTTQAYYAVDFLGEMHSGGSGQAQIEKVQVQDKIKTKVIDPHEDLLLKSKKKLSKKEKEIISSAPPIPSAPLPRSLTRTADNSSSEIPGLGSGVGIGFGDGGGSFGGGGSGNFPYTWYVRSIKKKLDSNWNVTTGFSARIYTQVAFTIRRDGSVSQIEIEESSKNEIFDRAALRAVEFAHPLPPLPSDFPESELRVHVRFTLKH